MRAVQAMDAALAMIVECYDIDDEVRISDFETKNENENNETY